MARYPSFVGGSYTSQSPIADQQRTVCFYPEILEAEGGKSRIVLYPSPGVETFAEASALSPCRGAFYQNGRAFFVMRDRLIEIFTDGSFTARGSPGDFPADGHPVTIAANGDGGGEIFITSNNQRFIFDLTANTVTLIAGAAYQGGMIDGYFLALDQDTSTLFISDLLDGTTWDPTQFAQRTAAPDKWVALQTADSARQVWLFGDETTEVWYNAGTFPFPFAPVPSGLLPYGIAAPWSAVHVGGSMIWLSRSNEGSGQVVMADGTNPRVISTYPMQVAFQGYLDTFGVTALDDAIGDDLEFLGHTFYILTFPTADATWVYDKTSGEWVEWLTWDSLNSAYTAWRPLHHINAFGRHLVGDRLTGTVYRLSHEVGTDVEDLPIRRLRRAPALTDASGSRMFYSRFELVLQPGIGANSGQGSDPQVILYYSNDGGRTWISAGQRSAGAQGEYQKRVIWNRLGSAIDRAFQVVVTDPVYPWALIDAFLDVKPGIVRRAS